MRSIPLAALLLAALAAAPAPALATQAPAQVLALRDDGPPPARWPQDPANQLYRQAREALNDEEYTQAANLFQRIRQRYPRSSYTPDAMYWEAFARYRIGGEAQLRQALGGLRTQRQRYPNAATRRDAVELMTRIQGELARRGDPESAERVTERARGATQGCSSEDDDTRVAALNALLQMDAEEAVPLLRRVLARRDACSVELRKQAVFLLAQKRTAETEGTLLNIARTDPSGEVREQAVFWLSQVGTERAVDLIDEILRTTNDDEMRDKAIFALSQHRSPRAFAMLRAYAERENAPGETREKAIFWIGQRGSQENAAFLRSLFARTRDDELKDKIMFSLSQMRGYGNDRWLLGIVNDPSHSVEVRKKAIFSATQAGVATAEFAAMYDRARDEEIKEQLIFALSQRGRDEAAITKLIEIARRDADREMRKKALFWLGQSRDPRARDAISDIINQ